MNQCDKLASPLNENPLQNRSTRYSLSLVALSPTNAQNQGKFFQLTKKATPWMLKRNFGSRLLGARRLHYKLGAEASTPYHRKKALACAASLYFRCFTKQLALSNAPATEVSIGNSSIEVGWKKLNTNPQKNRLAHRASPFGCIQLSRTKLGCCRSLTTTPKASSAHR